MDKGTEMLYRETTTEDVYTRLAEDPYHHFPFPTGGSHAVDGLGYNPAELMALPLQSVERFAGVGNPLSIDPPRPGETVLDVGCGAGVDLLLAAWRVGEHGCAIGIDPTPGMRRLARRGAEQMGLRNLHVLAGSLEYLPMREASVDVVVCNGVLNLCRDKDRAFKEIRRALKPGGRLLLAAQVVEGVDGDALTERRLLSLARRNGLSARIAGRIKIFEDACDTGSQHTVHIAAGAA
jgi:arsenite methyltransferase